ncbi:MAG TPA: sodium:glutamate symporter [Bacillota bacterium]|nr:sodium:glutamate symporter [Bacillota bacterium]
MDFSSENSELWNAIIQLGILSIGLMAATFLRRKIPFVRNALMPTAVLTGFLFLILKVCGIELFDNDFLEMLTYHGIAIGFIAMSLRRSTGSETSSNKTAFKSGALIVSTYLVQAVTGLVITLLLAYTFMPDLFEAAGLLLPMGYGQGPGQANNIGSTYEALGFTGGQSFGLAIAAAGYVCACIVGVIYINILNRKRKAQRMASDIISGSVTIDDFQNDGEIPVSESIDKFSVQVALVMGVYLVTYLFTWGLTSLLEKVAPGVASTVSSLLWGFNFIIGSALAILTKVLVNFFRKKKIITRQYQNNYLLSRISGVAFDVMIVAGIAAIDIEELSGLWVPFVLLAVIGGIITFIYLRFMSAKLYPEYKYEGFVSMFGMLTGTISSGILLLREIDPSFKTPAANNLVLGTSYGIVLGAPVLILVGYAPQSLLNTWITLIISALYTALLIFVMLFRRKKQ